MDHAADMERPAVRTLEFAARRIALAGTAGARTRPVRWEGLGGGHAIPYDGRCVSRRAARSGALGISGIERADVRDLPGRAGRLLFQPGCVQSAGGVGSAADLPLALFLRANVRGC